jgi:hypothetical protein
MLIILKKRKNPLQLLVLCVIRSAITSPTATVHNSIVGEANAHGHANTNKG